LKYVEEAVRILDREYEGRVREGFGGDG